MNFDLEDISKWRTEIMGISAIMILLCHSVVAKVELPNIVTKILVYGNLGVDIFLLVSGFGMFYSCRYATATEGGYSKWLKRRLNRIIIPYIVILGPYWIFDFVVNSRSTMEFMFRFTMLSFWTKHIGTWYIAMLIPLYFIVPFWNKIFISVQNKWVLVLFMIILNMILGLHSFESDSNSIIENIVFCLRRLPSFYVGWYLAYKKNNNINISVLSIPVFVGIFIIGQLFLDRLCWYWTAAISTTMILAELFKLIQNMTIGKIFNIVGKHSLELYLTNYLFLFLLAYVPSLSTNASINKGNYIYYGLVLIFGIVSAFIYHLLCKSISKNIIGGTGCEPFKKNS
ncbi:acyltransferase family protein [Eubacterium xylanophilum]|uniref:acyltransferase family protein n=1 Tax=Eubacterium xylanophilum TaxID=39497 RepID=UPI00047CD2A0|nr:acyltransferase [Eubacterium xylanophilum]